MDDFSIRTLRADDADQLLQFERDNRDWFERHVDARGDGFYTPDGVRDHIHQYLDAYAGSTWHPCVLLDQGGAIVGRANLKNIDLAARSAEAGCRIAQQHSGNGLAARALNHLRDEARARWGLERLSAFVAIDNAASVRVVQKCGFIRAERVEKMAVINGSPVDGFRFDCDLAVAPATPGAADSGTAQA